MARLIHLNLVLMCVTAPVQMGQSCYRFTTNNKT